MMNNRDNRAHGSKWKARFIPRSAYAEMGVLSSVSGVITFRNVNPAALRRVADLLTAEMLCQECHVQEDTTLVMVNPDFGMMIAIDFNNFLIAAFEQENYDLEIS